MPTKNTVAKFWATIKQGSENECWPWTGYVINKDGYGGFRFHGKTWTAHRLAYFLHFGAFDSDLCVCHRCDNPPCCNPTHLFLGTHQDNMRDMTQKKRYSKLSGENSGSHKLTEGTVRQIMGDRLLGLSHKALARKYSVSQSAIGHIVMGHSWKHLGFVPPKYDWNEVKGENNPTSVLTDKLVKELRDKYATGNYSFVTLSKEFGIAAMTAYHAVKRHTWRHVP